MCLIKAWIKVIKNLKFLLGKGIEYLGAPIEVNQMIAVIDELGHLRNFYSGLIELLKKEKNINFVSITDFLLEELNH